jgi:hypothetical protein
VTSVFDGMAGILAEVFGSKVVHTPAGGGSVQVTAVFREENIAVSDDNGREILGVLPILRVPRPAAGTISRGDVIAPGNGKTYRVVAPQISGSPASDAFTVFELELVA